jgi:acetoin utilization protein AcuB
MEITEPTSAALSLTDVPSAAMQHRMRVREYMTSKVVYANLTDGLRQTFYRMREHGIRHMPVLGDREQLVGLISDRDLRRPDWVDTEENVAHYYILDNKKKVEGAMSINVMTVKAEDPVEIALDILLQRRYGALPVVDDAGALVGMLSAVDLLRAFRDSLSSR